MRTVLSIVARMGKVVIMIYLVHCFYTHTETVFVGAFSSPTKAEQGIKEYKIRYQWTGQAKVWFKIDTFEIDKVIL